MNLFEGQMHESDGWKFRRLRDGSVEIEPGETTRFDRRDRHIIGKNAWASIVSHVSLGGETATSWAIALDYHMHDVNSVVPSSAVLSKNQELVNAKAAVESLKAKLMEAHGHIQKLEHDVSAQSVTINDLSCRLDNHRRDRKTLENQIEVLKHDVECFSASHAEIDYIRKQRDATEVALKDMTFERDALRHALNVERKVNAEMQYHRGTAVESEVKELDTHPTITINVHLDHFAPKNGGE